MIKTFKILIYFILFCSIKAQDDTEIIKVLENVSVRDIHQDKDGLWVATDNKGIYFLSNKTQKWENFSTANNKIQMDLFYCITSNKDFVWAGSVDGLFVLDKKTMRWIRRKFNKGGPLSNWIRSIKYDETLNSVWIGRFAYLTNYDVNEKKWTDYDLTRAGNTKTNTIKAIQIDGDSLVWFGTESGIHKYEKSKRLESSDALTFYDNKLNHFNGEGVAASISTILFEQNNIWLGMDEFKTVENPEFNIGGIYRFDRGNDWWRFDSYNGLNGNGIYDLELTGNYIWASLYQFSKATSQEFGRGIALINRITKEVRMLPEDKIPLKVFSMYFDGNSMWLGADNGLYKISFDNKLAKWELKK